MNTWRPMTIGDLARILGIAEESLRRGAELPTYTGNPFAGLVPKMTLPKKPNRKHKQRRK